MGSETALVVALLALLLVLSWTVWYCVGHQVREAEAKNTIIATLQRRLWIERVAEDPAKAQAALQLESALGIQFPPPAPRPDFNPFPDDDALLRGH